MTISGALLVDLLDEYKELRANIFDYFGYTDDWRVLPFDDARKYYWSLTGGGSSINVRFAESLVELEDEEAREYYENEIYTQHLLPKGVHSGEKYTMIRVDAHGDGNPLLQIFSNDKEVF